jgi:lipopolysaccharide export system protein LptC
MTNKTDELKAYLIVAVLVIIGLLWFMVDGRKNDNTAPCGHDYVAQYGSQDCQNYQQQQDQQSDYKNCGFRPAC